MWMTSLSLSPSLIVSLLKVMSEYIERCRKHTSMSVVNTNTEDYIRSGEGNGGKEERGTENFMPDQESSVAPKQAVSVVLCDA